MRRAVMVVALGMQVACSGTRRGGVMAGRPVYDFGAVEQGVPVQQQFLLKNMGRSLVRLEGTTSSCGCTTASPVGQILRPGQLALVYVSLDTWKLAGQTTKTVVVNTSDAQTPRVMLVLTGTVLTDLLVAPSTVYLGQVWRGDPARHELTVRAGRPPGGPGYAVSGVETESRVLHARIEPGQAQNEQKVVVELDPDAPPGRFDDEISIHTTSPRQPVIKVPVFGHILG